MAPSLDDTTTLREGPKAAGTAGEQPRLVVVRTSAVEGHLRRLPGQVHARHVGHVELQTAVPDGVAGVVIEPANLVVTPVERHPGSGVRRIAGQREELFGIYVGEPPLGQRTAEEVRKGRHV